MNTRAIGITTAVAKTTRRLYSTTTTTTTVYIDDWYNKIKKSKQFYEEFSSRKTRRYYFYNIDLQGRLFLEETFPKNIATSIKDEKFLDFFFSKIRWANTKEFDFLAQNEISDDYPFVSKCGSETNFIRPAAMPIVFHSLVDDTLFYGGNLGVPFESDRLAISKDSGKFYYRMFDGHKERTSGQSKNIDYGLISSSVGVALSKNISVHECYEERFLYDNITKIDWLPARSEPGKWAMPNTIDCS
mmetsp:Transcript_29808/g.62205  ORF Transcript_29808/g.62205 Transcript_29808/m.62205 type:complete len:244 (+) Transcript_29808:106-837(+)